MIRRFELQRDVDVSGVSGTGVVAEGVQFSDGTCALRWLGDYAMSVTSISIEHVSHVHGHDGLTKVNWLDTEVKF